MSRLSPRVTKYLPAQLQPRGNGQYFQTHLINIGPDGANLKSKKNLPSEAITPGTSHSVKLFLYGFGDMMIDAAVVRGNPESVALNFSGIPRGDRQKIWEFIRDDLAVALASDGVKARQAALERSSQTEFEQVTKPFEEALRDAGLGVVMLQAGPIAQPAIFPLVDGKPIPPEEFEQLHAQGKIFR